MKTEKEKITERMWSKEIEEELNRKVACGLLKKTKMKGLWAYQNAHPIMNVRLNREIIWDISQKSYNAGETEAIKQDIELVKGCSKMCIKDAKKDNWYYSDYFKGYFGALQRIEEELKSKIGELTTK